MAPKKLMQFKQREEASVDESEDEPASGAVQMVDDPGQLTLQDLAEIFCKNMEL